MSQVAHPQTVEEYISAHPEADPGKLLEVLLQQNVRIRDEYKISSEVELDDNFNFKPKTMAQLIRVARMYAESGIVPDHYKNNIAACAIAIQMALRCRVNILTFLQQSYIVYGKCGVEAKLAIAMLIVSGKVEGRVRYKFAGDGRSRACTAFVTDKDSGEEFQQTVTWATVEAEGWDKEKKGQISKWVSMPDVMFQYRSGMFLIRAYYPDVLLGMLSLDELEDIGAIEPGVIPSDNGAGPAAETIADLSNRLGAKPKRKKSQEIQPGPTDDQTPEPEAAADPSAGPVAEAVTDKPKRRSRAAKSAPDQEQAQTAPEYTADTVQNQGNGTAEQGRRAPMSTGNGAQSESQEKTEPKTEVAATGPVAPVQGKKTLSIEGAVSYMKARHEDAAESFDLVKIAERAIGQANPSVYMDQIVTKANPNWANFVLRAEAEGDADEPGDNEDASFSQDAPECITDPVQKPKLLSPGAQVLAGKIIKLSLASSIRRMPIDKEKNLTSDEMAWLMDLAERRAWQLEHEIEPTDTL